MMVRRTDEGAWKWALRDFLREAARPESFRQNVCPQFTIPDPSLGRAFPGFVCVSWFRLRRIPKSQFL